MTNAELAAYLNAELNLSGGATVTANVVRQWVLWDVLPRAVGRGRGYGRGFNWQRTDRDLRRALQLAEWRIGGVTREQALIVHAYTAWGYRDWERVREALAAELDRSTAAIRKRLSADLSFQSFAETSATRKRAFRNQLGPLDSRFAGTQFELSPELYAVAAQAVFDADVNKLQLHELVRHVANKMGLSQKYLTPVFPILGEAVIGLFASPDESEVSAQFIIRSCTQRDLRLARVWLRIIQRIFEYDGPTLVFGRDYTELFTILKAIKIQLTEGHWQISSLSLILRIGMVLRLHGIFFNINPE